MNETKEHEELQPYVKSTNVSRQNRRGKGIGLWLFILIATPAIYFGLNYNLLWISLGGTVIALLLGSMVKVAHEWQRAVVLRMGRFKTLAGPGLFYCLPVIDHVTAWIDLRIRTSYFAAEKTLTRDNVPVDVDAVMFWGVWDPQKAALEVEKYKEAVTWAAQTALRDIIGKTELSEMLAGREHLDEELQKMIDERTEEWGIAVRSVEIRDVVIPKDLQDVMSREAQAERERRARNILGRAEVEIADNFVAAAHIYKQSEAALYLRSINLLYESIKERGGLVVVPSNFTNMDMGWLAGLTQYRESQNQHEKTEE